uniref:Uncharacterized protein n=1 Tax=Strombidium inclinatum TaxID=197538 RepID=A0A7S3MXH3_9SPIT|mmetsp:Transcript_1799/g.2369  ORF Transcript_1799/g.2369 Transcript_1799/m.2369 type:complete len:282 (+) Transcript_1799:2057-2902(+)
MFAIGSVVHERVQQLDHLRVLGVEAAEFIGGVDLILVVALETLDPINVVDVLGDNIQNFHFIVGRHLVTRGTLLNFQGDESVLVLHVPGEPHCRELAPAKLLHYHVAVHEDLTEVHGVVPSHLVLFNTFVFAVVSGVSVQVAAGQDVVSKPLVVLRVLLLGLLGGIGFGPLGGSLTSLVLLALLPLLLFVLLLLFNMVVVLVVLRHVFFRRRLVGFFLALCGRGLLLQLQLMLPLIFHTPLVANQLLDLAVLDSAQLVLLLLLSRSDLESLVGGHGAHGRL